MKINKFIIIPVLFLVSSVIYSQEVKDLKTTGDLDSLFSSLKGKTAIVNIWATWCFPCVKEFPDLIKLYSNYKETGFELVFISVDATEDKKDVKEFLKNKGVDFVTYFNEFSKPEEIINYFDNTWGGEIPATYIYNREGKQVKKIIGTHSYEKFERELIEVM
jgi:thiol-disulfide isomerase/thioredoxin